MKFLQTNTNPSLPPKSTLIRQVIIDELSSVQKNRLELMTATEPQGLHIFVVICCILINGIFFFSAGNYIILFIAASFYLNMFYFITLLIPLSSGSASMSKTDISRFKSWLNEMGVKSAATRFSRFFLNVFFIGSRTLFMPITLLFTLDVLFTLIAYFSQNLSFHITLIMIAQVLAFILFYFIVWKLEPFSTTFMKNIEWVKNRLSVQFPPWLINAMITIGMVLALLLIVTTIFLLPGLTVNAFLNQSGLIKLGHLFGLIAILAISQYFIVRYIHGFTSHTMAERIFYHKEERLKQLIGTEVAIDTQASSLSENPDEALTLLLESKIYHVVRNSLLGAFPVYVVNLDFSVILDSSTLTTIREYIQDIKA